MTKPTVVDADGHILEPTDLWERYLEPQYRDRAIRFRADRPVALNTSRLTARRVRSSGLAC